MSLWQSAIGSLQTEVTARCWVTLPSVLGPLAEPSRPRCTTAYLLCTPQYLGFGIERSLYFHKCALHLNLNPSKCMIDLKSKLIQDPRWNHKSSCAGIFSSRWRRSRTIFLLFRSKQIKDYSWNTFLSGPEIVDLPRLFSPYGPSTVRRFYFYVLFLAI